ncbi:MAG: triose-phosphate isomerase [Candidatus Paceibacterota bacterium]
MKKRKLTIIANWKANPDTLGNARTLFRSIKIAVKKLVGVEVFVCPPFVYLHELSKISKTHKLSLGAQGVSLFEGGAHTGEISPAMLSSAGVSVILIGHSEQREQGESDKNINEKIKLALKYGFRVVLCVGEKVRDRDGEYFRVVKEQLQKDLKGVARGRVENIMIAYEPIWAIGAHAKHADTPENFVEMSIFIRKVLNELYSKQHALGATILYGGSVNDKNAESFLLCRETQGFLIGRASLDGGKFKEILTLAHILR